ncbi:MAG: triose-phosphate isomerase [Calditrichota bacterium]
MNPHREIVIAGNWKMNTTPEEGVALAKSLIESLRRTPGVTVVICPPATHLGVIGGQLKSSSAELGAQNVHWEKSGAYTGEISAEMLLEVGCRWAIIGHSERRLYFGETDQTVNKRAHRALEAGLRPIVCIGETLAERESGQTFDTLRRQVQVGLEGLTLTGKGGLVIAYEPVWAIGTGRTATPEQAQEAHHFIRDLLAEQFSPQIAELTVIQYGGSVTAANAEELLTCPDVDGALVGGASLKIDSFLAIVQAAS